MSVSFANIFSHSKGCLLVLFMVSITGQTLLSFIRSNLLVFIFITLGGESKEILLRFTSKSVLPMFSSKRFTVSGLTFRPQVRLKCSFVCAVRERSNFALLHVAVRFPSITY